MNYQETVDQIINAVGGAENIQSAGNCATRLRFILKDSSIVDDNKVKLIKAVKGVSRAAGQYQIIIGTDVEEFFKTLQEKYHFESVDYSGKDNVKISDIVFGTMQKTMFPLFGILAGSGMINALLAIMANTHIIETTNPTYAFFNTIAGCAAYALPVLVGMSFAKAVNTDIYIGMLIGLIMEYPAMTALIGAEGGASIFGLAIQKYTYSGTVIPIILAVLLEKVLVDFLKKHIPSVIQYFVVPMLVLLVVMPAVYLVLGPVGNMIAGLLGNFFLWMMGTFGTIAMAIMTPCLTFLVAAGMHMALSPIFRGLRAEIGYDPLFSPAFLVFNIGVAGSALAYAVTSDEEERKGLGISAFISGLCGISEPALYGTILVSKKNLIATLAALALGGAVGGVLQLRNYNFTPNSIFGLFGYGFEGTSNFTSALIASLVGFVACFVFNYVVNKGLKKKDEN